MIMLEDMTPPNIDNTHIDIPDYVRSCGVAASHPVRILLLYGSLRPRSFSRLVIEECARLLVHFGADVKIFHPEGLPAPDSADEQHPKVQELRDLMIWSEGQVWCSPERHDGRI